MLSSLRTPLGAACEQVRTRLVLVELGQLLDEDQNVLISGTRPTTAVLREQLDELVGRRVGRELNADYVAYHRSYSFIP